MKTLLVLAEHPDLVDALRSGLNPAQYRLIHRTKLEDAEPLFVHGLADACLIDLALSNIQGVWFLEKVSRLSANLPIIIYTAERQLDLEEAAYL